MELTARNTIVLAIKRTYPRGCWGEKNYWFDQFPKGSDLLSASLARNESDNCCISALLAKGVGQNEAPTIANWISFVLAGAIIATKTRKYIIPPEKKPYDWESNIEQFVWEQLWMKIQWKRHPLDSDFVVVMLREFVPRHHMGGELYPSFCRSTFAGLWPHVYQPVGGSSIHSLLPETLELGNRSFDTSSEEIQDSILQVAEHVPTMLEIANARIRKTYSW
ncbi:MAG TPA: hypothetical protein VJJ80_02745 [Patescibacteria group bacterium]|nr:hypothetical protein [Patescibacteria group bacterium]